VFRGFHEKDLSERLAWSSAILFGPLLFVALMLEGMDLFTLKPYDVRNRRTVAHSVIKDLLSAGCIWTTEIDQWAL